MLNKLNLEADDPYIPDNYKDTMREETIEVKYYFVSLAMMLGFIVLSVLEKTNIIK